MYASAVSISGPDVGERPQRRLEVLQVLHQVGLGVVDESGRGVAESAAASPSAVVIRGRSLISTSSAGGILFKRAVMTSCWPASVAANRSSSSMVAMMLSRC